MFPCTQEVEREALVCFCVDSIRAYNTVIPECRAFYSGIQIAVLVKKYRFFGTILKDNCL
jgi:transcription termination factor Rho